MKLPAKLKMWALVNQYGEMLPKVRSYEGKLGEENLPLIRLDKPNGCIGSDDAKYRPVRVVVTIEKASPEAR